MSRQVSGLCVLEKNRAAERRRRSLTESADSSNSLLLQSAVIKWLSLPLKTDSGEADNATQGRVRSSTVQLWDLKRSVSRLQWTQDVVCRCTGLMCCLGRTGVYLQVIRRGQVVLWVPWGPGGKTHNIKSTANQCILYQDTLASQKLKKKPKTPSAVIFFTCCRAI